MKNIGDIEFSRSGIYINFEGDELELLQHYSAFELISVLIANPQIDISRGHWYVTYQTR